MARSFWLAGPCRQGSWVLFPPEESHHILHVLRKKPGETVEVLCREERLRVELVLEGEVLKGRLLYAEPLPPPSLALDLAQSLPKGRKIEQVISTASQIGVRNLLPFLSSRSLPHLEVEDGLKKVIRWQKIADEEAKITGSRPLQVAPPATLEAVLNRGSVYDLRLFCWENAEQLLVEILTGRELPTSVLLVVGPEGGFAPQEAQAAIDHSFMPVSLGSRILRSEIAGLVAGIILLERCGAF